MIVFDSSTLILLAKVELLDLFLENYPDKICIPRKVFEESCTKQTFDDLLIRKRIEEGKIKVIEIKNQEAKRKIILDFGLGHGEAEAIVLATELKAEIIGLDDRAGINACKLLKLPFTTAIAILVRSHEKKLLSTKKATDLLQKLSYYGRYKEEIIEDAKKVLGDKNDKNS